MPSPTDPWLRRAEWPLLAVAVAVVAAEALLWAGPFAEGQTAASAWWHVPGALIAFSGLAASRLLGAPRPAAVVAVGVLAYLGFVAVHALVGGPQSPDVALLYPEYGAQLLASGDLPTSEYPPLAHLLFAAAAFLGEVRTTLPLLVLPLLAAAWWQLGRIGPWGPWAAAVAALGPAILPFWNTHYDALPTALLVLGLVAAARGRHGWAGWWLGCGAAAKWSPGLAAVVLVVGALAAGDRRAAARTTGLAGVGFAVWHLPFLSAPTTLLAPYTFHAGRGITGESLPYLPLRALGLASVPDRPWFEASVPAWAPTAALVLLAVALVAVAAWAWARPAHRLHAAAAAPVVFLAGNRIFSPQFVATIAACLAVAMALQGDRRPRAHLTFAGALTVAATANYAVWPTAAPAWVALQVLLFASLAVAAGVALRPPAEAGELGGRETATGAAGDGGPIRRPGGDGRAAHDAPLAGDGRLAEGRP